MGVSALLGWFILVCRLSAAPCLLLMLALPGMANAATEPGSLNSSDARLAEWGLSGSLPQTGSSAHTSGRAFIDAQNGYDPRADPRLLVVIDKSSQEMGVFLDEVEQYTWKVSTGLPAYATPSGTHPVTSMNEMWYSREWDDAPMPHSIFFTKKGHAIHGTEERKKLGKPASHGCVRLAPDNAATLFALVKEVGIEKTEVVLNGDTPGGESKVASPPPRKKQVNTNKRRDKARIDRAEFEKPRPTGRRGWRHRYSGMPGEGFHQLAPSRRGFYQRY